LAASWSRSSAGAMSTENTVLTSGISTFVRNGMISAYTLKHILYNKLLLASKTDTIQIQTEKKNSG
jgi:hypothetical protein